MQYSPNGHEITASKPPSQWKQVSIGDSHNIYTLCNVPVEPLGIQVSQVFAFGRVELIDMTVESKMAGGSDDEQNGGDSGVDGMTSSGDVDST